MLVKTFSVFCVFALGVIAAPVVEVTDLAARQLLPDAISTRSKWQKRDAIVETAKREVTDLAARQLLPDAISTRSKWHKRDVMRAEIAARNPLPEPEPEAQPEADVDAENFVDCCISTRSKWASSVEPVEA